MESSNSDDVHVNACGINTYVYSTNVCILLGRLLENFEMLKTWNLVCYWYVTFYKHVFKCHCGQRDFPSILIKHTYDDDDDDDFKWQISTCILMNKFSNKCCIIFF